MKMKEPIGRAMKASEKTANDISVAVTGSGAKGKISLGNTRIEPMPYTKKSKNSEVRPMTTPMATLPGDRGFPSLWMRRASCSRPFELGVADELMKLSKSVAMDL